MDKIQKVKSISIWIFLIPFIAVNTCLILITEFQWLFPNQEDIIHNTFPYLDGGASISRTVRPYPSWLIFKPAMFLTSFFLIKYWYYSKDIVVFFNKDHKHLKKVFYFGKQMQDDRTTSNSTILYYKIKRNINSQSNQLSCTLCTHVPWYIEMLEMYFCTRCRCRLYQEAFLLLFGYGLQFLCFVPSSTLQPLS